MDQKVEKDEKDGTWWKDKKNLIKEQKEKNI